MHWNSVERNTKSEDGEEEAEVTDSEQYNGLRPWTNQSGA